MEPIGLHVPNEAVVGYHDNSSGAENALATDAKAFDAIHTARLPGLPCSPASTYPHNPTADEVQDAGHLVPH